MNDKISQDTINKALWAACDTFRGTISADTYKDFILTMLFLKYISDVWQDHYDEYKNSMAMRRNWLKRLMANERFVLPKSASFYALYERRHEPGNGERIDQALHAIEESQREPNWKMPGKACSRIFRLNTDRLGEEKRKKHHPSSATGRLRRWRFSTWSRGSCRYVLDVIGNAYEYLIKNFAASGGRQESGEFYTPPEVSDLIAETARPQPGDTICDPAGGFSGSLLMKCGVNCLRAW